MERNSNSLINLFFFSSKKPKKINLSEKPLIDNEVITDEAPGIGVIGISLLIHSFTNNLPGSEIAGVPASEISDIILPLIK